MRDPLLGPLQVMHDERSIDLADYLDEAADERILIAAHGREGYEFAHGVLPYAAIGAVHADPPHSMPPSTRTTSCCLG